MLLLFSKYFMTSPAVYSLPMPNSSIFPDLHLVDRQVNDKERLAAALEKEDIMRVIEDLIRERY